MKSAEESSATVPVTTTHNKVADDYDGESDDEPLKSTGSNNNNNPHLQSSSSGMIPISHGNGGGGDLADISPHPIDVLSHFFIISDASVKTPKYRCKCCKYEFTASSTTRLKQHIMGYDVYTADTPKKVVKDIKECSCPFLPLKEALIAEFNNNRLHKRPREEREGRLSSSGDDMLHNLNDSSFMSAPKSGRKKQKTADAPKTPTVSWNEASVAARDYPVGVASKESFDENCPEFEVSETSNFSIPAGFKTDAPILEWLETVVGDWLSAINQMAYREGSSFRYAVYEVLKSVAGLSETHRLFAHNPSFDSVETFYAIDRFASRNLNQSSMTAEPALPANIDTTNATQMKDLYAAIGKYANGHGRVDFSVMDRNTNKIRCIVEVNEALDSNLPANKLKGFWEILLDLVHTYYLNGSKSPLFAILTDYKTWVFFKLDGNSIQYSTPYSLFNGDHLHTPEISDQSYSVSKFLYEIFQISASTNLKQKSESVTLFKKNFAEASLLTLKDNLRIAQEIKRKDDEINKLREELAKLKKQPPAK